MKPSRKKLIAFLLILISIEFVLYFFDKTKSILFLLGLLIICSILIQFLFRLKAYYSVFLIRFFITFLFSLELFFGALNFYSISEQVRVKEDKSGRYTKKDAILGYKFIPNLNKVSSCKVAGNDTIYNVSYSSDELSRRVDFEKNDLVSNKNKHAIFVGGSFTFGEGLMNRYSFPSVFEARSDSFQMYNYGFRGYGPHQIALFFYSGVDVINRDLIKQKRGFMLYTYISAHLERVYGGSDYLKYGSSTPDVFVDGDSLIFRKRSRVHLLLSLIINESYTLRFFQIKLKHPETDEFYKRFASIVNYSAKEYWNLFPNGEFYVSIFPHYHASPKWLMYLDKKIRIIEIEQPSDIQTNRESYNLSVKYDRHPSAKYNTYYANELIKKMN